MCEPMYNANVAVPQAESIEIISPLPNANPQQQINATAIIVATA